MKGHMKQRSKGSWTLWVDIGRDSETGKRKQQTLTVHGTKTDAQRKLRDLLHSLDMGSYAKPSRLTVSEFLKEWLQSYVATNTAPRTRDRYEEIVKLHLIPAFGSVPLVALKPQHIQKYYAKALESGRRDGKGGLSARTVHKHHRVLFAALKYAIKHNFLVRNPAEAVDPPRPQSSEVTKLGANDVQLILDAAKRTPYYAVLFTAAYTGLRRGELLGLRWCDVDLPMATLSVVQTLQVLRSGEYFFKEPKTRRSRRQIALSPDLVLLLTEYRLDQEDARRLLGKALAPDDLVFPQSDGRPLRPNTLTRFSQTIAKKVGLDGITLHSLRHAHATILLQRGVHPKIVQERLGHSSIATTLDIYSHVVPGLQESAARQFDEGLKGIPSKTEAVLVN